MTYLYIRGYSIIEIYGIGNFSVRSQKKKKERQVRNTEQKARKEIKEKKPNRAKTQIQ